MDSASKFRRAEIEMIKKNLENQLVHYYQTSARFKRWDTRCQTVCALTGGVATILTGSGLAASLSAVGVVVGGPLIATAALFSLVSTSCFTIKFFLRKAKKYRPRLKLRSARSTLSYQPLLKMVKSLTASTKILSKSTTPLLLQRQNCGFQTTLTVEWGDPTPLR